MRQKPLTGDVKINHVSIAGWLYHSIPIREHESEQKSKRKFVKVGEKQKRA